MKKTGKKGFTLTELCVVLALIAVVSGMVVSFALLISGRTKMSTARLNAMGDLELVESVTEAWMDSMALLGANIDTGLDNYGNSRLEATVDGNVRSLSFDGNTLTGTLPGGEEITVELEQVTEVNYTLMTNGTGDYLCICTVQLKLPKFSSSETETRTICIDPNVGDTYIEATE